MKTYKIIISGKVQGVGYREGASKTAKQLQLCGTVKNLSTGDVEILIQGDESKMEAMVRWCNKGPVLARVEKINFEEIKWEEKFTIFQIEK